MRLGRGFVAGASAATANDSGSSDPVATASDEVSSSRRFIRDVPEAANQSLRPMRRPGLERSLELEPLALREEFKRIVVHDLLDLRLAVSATFHLLDELWHRQRIRRSPVAGRVDHDPL